jgi:predicted O-methyltransferase YrrM
MSLAQMLESKGFHELEGYSQQIPQQVRDLQGIMDMTLKGTKDTTTRRIMEIGFNAGHSAEIFLQNPHTTVVSFDLGMHDYVSHAKEYIDHHYPHRHTLILGDSKDTIRAYIMKKHPPFDIIFIDGDHEYNAARMDMNHCFHLAHKDTIVILDDTMYQENWQASWTLGPTKVWKEDLAARRLVELGRNDYCPGRGMSWGKYL